MCCVADHDNMDSENFMNWVKDRLCPTFEAVYGSGTTLGGDAGKTMIVVVMHILFPADFCV